MQSKDQAELLLEELCVRFQKKPRKCRKTNDSGIGSSDRVVCISNGRFYYYPKIQEFNDLDFDKLQYVVPKAGVLLSEILQLKFPPRKNNERNYFTIVIPKNKILKYTKTFKQMVMQQFAEGQQTWKFVFDYDIISLPDYEKKAALTEQMQKQKQMLKKKKEEQQARKQEQEKKRYLEQEYESLAQAQKLRNQRGQSQIQNKNREEKSEEERERIINEADDFHYQMNYQMLLNISTSMNEAERLETQLNFLQVVGRFKVRAEQVVRKYINELPFDPEPKFQTQFVKDNLKLYIGFSKAINLEFLDNRQSAYQLYNCRKQINIAIRIPLMCIIKYKGLKILVRTITPVDTMPKKQRSQKILHGNCEQTWKTHFFLVDDLNLLLEGLNLKSYSSQVNYQRVVIHLGTEMKMIETLKFPFQKMKDYAQKPQYRNVNIKSLIYLLDIKELYPIDLNLEQNINQTHVRLRPEYVCHYSDHGEKVKLGGGALTYEYQDEEGMKDDLHLAKASQNLKYRDIPTFVKQLDQLKYIPLNSSHFKSIIKSNGINIRYLGSILKLTSLPYIRQMVKVQVLAREIKKIFRDHQKQYCFTIFREAHRAQILDAFNQKNLKSLQAMRRKQLAEDEKKSSMQNAIDFLNLIFGNTEECKCFWDIIKKNVKENYKIEIKDEEYMNLPHGYLLKTVLDHCGFQISLKSSVLLFATPFPFSIKDWIKFKIRSQSYTFPSLEVYKKAKIPKDIDKDQIITRLQLQIYLRRIMGEDDSAQMIQLSYFVPEINPPKQKFSVESLNYYINRPSKQNFQLAYEICTFIMPSSHPIFQDLYLAYSKIPEIDPVVFKRAAENHSIRTLGLTHWKTSSILANFKQHQYLRHLIDAQVGVVKNKKMELQHKIVKQQAELGRYIQCFIQSKQAISYAESNTLSPQEQIEYFQLLKISMDVTYKLRKIEDMLKISQFFWIALEKYKFNSDCNEYIYLIMYFCIKGYLESSKQKYYLFKLALILNEKLKNRKLKPTNQLVSDLREMCRQAKNHINWIKQMLSKLSFGYTEISFLPDFFTNFDRHVENLYSQEFDQGISQINLALMIFGIKYFEEALLDRSYTFDQGSNWDIPKKKQKNK